MQILKPNAASSQQNPSPIPSLPPVTTAHVPPPYLSLQFLLGRINFTIVHKSFAIKTINHIAPIAARKYIKLSVDSSIQLYSSYINYMEHQTYIKTGQMIDGYEILRQIQKGSTQNFQINQWRICEVVKLNEFFRMKIFHPQMLSLCKTEKDILHIVKKGPFTVQIVDNEQTNEQSHTIVLKGPLRFNLEDYLIKFGKFSPQIVKDIIRQVLKSLKYAISQEIVHKRVKLKDILMTSEDHVLLAGWHAILPHNQSSVNQLIFSCGEAIITMITGHAPFQKYNANDNLYKYVLNNKMQLFWKQIVPRYDFFNESLKKLLNSMFLGKITINEVLESEWVSSQSEQNEQISRIKEYFNHKKMQRKQIIQEQAKKREKFQKLVQRVKSECECARQVRGSDDIQNQDQLYEFIQVYQSMKINVEKLKTKAVSSGCLIIHNKIEQYVIAFIKNIFTQALNQSSSMVFPENQVQLQKDNCDLVDNQLTINLSFKNKIDPTQLICPFQIKVEFFKTKEDEIAVSIESRNINEQTFYSKCLVELIKNQIQILNNSASFQHFGQ